jgi:hypothetical protein
MSVSYSNSNGTGIANSSSEKRRNTNRNSLYSTSFSMKRCTIPELNKFVFGSKWTMFYNDALRTMQGNVPIILL